MTIVEFLEARIAEDEVVAEAATQGVWSVETGPGIYHIEVGRQEFTSDPEGLTLYAERDWEDDAAHITRHDPARVLAECKAKRVILQIAVDQIRLGQDAGAWKNWEDMATQNLHTLAAVYADHPDYQQEWAL